jgi:hypothetical protein
MPFSGAASATTCILAMTFPYFGALLGFFGGFAFSPTTYFVSAPQNQAKYHNDETSLSYAGWACIADSLHNLAPCQEAKGIHHILVCQLGELSLLTMLQLIDA